MRSDAFPTLASSSPAQNPPRFARSPQQAHRHDDDDDDDDDDTINAMMVVVMVFGVHGYGNTKTMVR